MQGKRKSTNYLSGILFLVLFFFSFSLFSDKLLPEQKTDASQDQVEALCSVHADALRPKPAGSFKLSPVQPEELPSFFSSSAHLPTDLPFVVLSVQEGRDRFCGFFHAHHSSYEGEADQLI